MSHGGKRKGAGRKPCSTRKEPFTVRLKPEHAEKFRSLCKSNGRSQSEQVAAWVKHDKRKVELIRVILELAEDELIVDQTETGINKAKTRIRRAIDTLLS